MLDVPVGTVKSARNGAHRAGAQRCWRSGRPAAGRSSGCERAARPPRGGIDVNCERFEARLDDYLDGTLSEVELRAAAAHEASCTACAALAARCAETLAPWVQISPCRRARPPISRPKSVARTSGVACGASRLPPGTRGRQPAGIGGRLVELHLAHCVRCAGCGRRRVAAGRAARYALVEASRRDWRHRSSRPRGGSPPGAPPAARLARVGAAALSARASHGRQPTSPPWCWRSSSAPRCRP